MYPILRKNIFTIFLISTYGQSEISKGIVGAVQLKLPIKNIQNISIKAPNLIIQKKISNILQSLDEKIELNCRINENLEQQAQALFKSWFVDGTNIELNYHELGNITSITAGGDKPSIYSKELTEKYYTPIYSNGIENEGLYGYTDFAKINSSSITISARGTIVYMFTNKTLCSYSSINFSHSEKKKNYRLNIYTYGH